VIEELHGYSQPLQANARVVSQIGHSSFLPQLPQISIHYSYRGMIYSHELITASLNEPYITINGCSWNLKNVKMDKTNFFPRLVELS
jgi:hypothetical protein